MYVKKDKYGAEDFQELNFEAELEHFFEMFETLTLETWFLKILNFAIYVTTFEKNVRLVLMILTSPINKNLSWNTF